MDVGVNQHILHYFDQNVLLRFESFDFSPVLHLRSDKAFTSVLTANACSGSCDILLCPKMVAKLSMLRDNIVS